MREEARYGGISTTLTSALVWNRSFELDAPVVACHLNFLPVSANFNFRFPELSCQRSSVHGASVCARK